MAGTGLEWKGKVYFLCEHGCVRDWYAVARGGQVGSGPERQVLVRLGTE